jgi:hypothetical protein
MNDKLKYRVDVLVKLADALRSDRELDSILARAATYNPWFTVGFSRFAIEGIISKMLNKPKLEEWLSHYAVAEDVADPKTVGIIMAGNLPLVGFHDFLCAYISGNGIKVKLSGKDDILFPYVYEKLLSIDPGLKERSAIIERLAGFDAVIATGSNNTNRYFEYYFRDYPKILRQNRNSVAILDGSETDEELYGLADDIFMYFGFGCRNVSKLYVPEEYDVTRLFPYFEKYKWMHDHTKYMNNYDYNRTLLLMNQTNHLSNEIIMIEENPAISSPVSVLYFERYKNVKILNEKLMGSLSVIQCIVAIESINFSDNLSGIVKFGHTQMPDLWYYADNVDTMDFLFSLKSLK